MTLNRLFIFHALATFAAGVALVLVPNAIPSSVGVQLEQGQFIIAYLLAGAEFGIAYLSFAATRIVEHGARRAIVLSFIVFHLSTAILEVYANLQGLSSLIWANVALRLLISALFAYFGLRRPK